MSSLASRLLREIKKRPQVVIEGPCLFDLCRVFQRYPRLSLLLLPSHEAIETVLKWSACFCSCSSITFSRPWPGDALKYKLNRIAAQV